MTDPIAALEADRDAVLTICANLGGSDWPAASGCPGWSVKDVLGHIGALFWAVVDPGRLPDVTGLATEAAQEVYVEASRGLGPIELVEDYEAVSAQALERLAGLTGEDFEIPLGDLGTYPAAALPLAFCFDHYLHIRADLFAPRGPLTGLTPPSDQLRVDPMLDWIEAAVAQQNRDRLAALNGAIEVGIEGVGARTVRIGAGEVAVRARCGAHDFALSVTQRRGWDPAWIEPGSSADGVAILESLRVF